MVSPPSRVSVMVEAHLISSYAIKNLKKQSMCLSIDEFTEMFTGAPIRRHYPVIASFASKTFVMLISNLLLVQEYNHPAGLKWSRKQLKSGIMIKKLKRQLFYTISLILMIRMQHKQRSVSSKNISKERFHRFGQPHGEI